MQEDERQATDDPAEPWFRNHYQCPRCQYEWTDDWSATCDDDCPRCGFRHVSPLRSEDLEESVDG
jgi:DNA-directed RNA polymerase subunit RPC12/RpoP